MSYIRKSKEAELQHSRDCPSQLIPRGCIIPQPVPRVLSWSCKSRPRDEEASLSWKHLLDGSGKEWDWNYTEENTTRTLLILYKADFCWFALILYRGDGHSVAGVFWQSSRYSFEIISLHSSDNQFVAFPTNCRLWILPWLNWLKYNTEFPRNLVPLAVKSRGALEHAGRAPFWNLSAGFEDAILTSSWLWPWNIHTGCGHHTASPSAALHPGKSSWNTWVCPESLGERNTNSTVKVHFYN